MDSDDERFMMGFGWPGGTPWLSDDGYDYNDYEYGNDEDDYDDYYDDSDDDYDSDDSEDDDMATRTPAQPPPAPLAPPPPTLCRFFVLGNCRFGIQCTFSHELPANAREQEEDEDVMATVAATLVDCPYFQRGKCKFGNRCRLRHAPPQTNTDPATAGPARAAAAADDEQEFTCGICLEDVVQVGKQFGLLSCDHCFCVDCLRTWRQSKNSNNTDNTRTCPACRVLSHYIVPSLKFCKGDEKLAVVDAYKRHLAIRACKHFDGTFRSCKFGADCFYAHRNSEGVDVKHLEVRRVRRRGRPRTGASAGGGNRRGSRGRRGGRNRNNGQAQPEEPDAVEIASMLDRYNEFFRLLDMLGGEAMEL